MKRKIVVRGLIVIVLLAAIAGCSDMFKHREHNYRGRRFGFSEEKVMRYRRKSMERLSRDLNLTQEQQTKVSEILDSGWQKIEAQYRDMFEKTRAIRTQTDSEIIKVLTPQQRAKFKERRAEFSSRRRHRESSPGQWHSRRNQPDFDRPPAPPRPEDMERRGPGPR